MPTTAEPLTKDDVELFTQERLGEWKSNEPEDFCHIVNQREYNLNEAYILGKPVVALCGYEWIPTRNPDRLPICHVRSDDHGGRYVHEECE